MPTILDSLKAINAYPIPLRTIDEVAVRRGLTLHAEATQEVLKGGAFGLAKADLLLWLSHAPNVSQGGQSYSFTDEQREDLRTAAYDLYDAFAEDEADKPKTIYGYKGSRL